MPRPRAARKPHARQRSARTRRPRRRRRGIRLASLLPSPRTRQRVLRAFRRAPAGLQVLLVLGLATLLLLGLNWVCQVVRKPSELFFPVSGTLDKTPAQTWHSYGPIFRKHSTAVITPTFLAALAQVEGSGNPVARTYWRWRWTHRPLEIYRPASSAVGMYQITDGTFAEARRYCIHNHVVVEDGPWHDWRSCWFNALYMRIVPSHAVEMTAAYLDRRVAIILARQRLTGATLAQKQRLAAAIHLCGAGAAERFARRGLRPAGQRCGDHDLALYLAKVDALQAVFARLAANVS